MSVLAGKRAESKMEFLNTAHELELQTIRMTMRENAIPKRYRYVLGRPLTDSARTLNQYIVYANGIFPTKKAEYEVRRKYQKRAMLEIQNMLELMRITTELIPIKNTVLEEWVKLATLEENLLRKWIQADRQRYKDLP